MRVVRYYDQDEVETDGAVHWNTVTGNADSAVRGSVWPYGSLQTQSETHGFTNIFIEKIATARARHSCQAS